MKSFKFSKNIDGDKDGIRMSAMEVVARHLSNRLSGYNSAVELCTGLGITAIQLSKKIKKVFAIDINSYRIQCAIQNAKHYGVQDRIEFIHGDALNADLLKSISSEVAVIDPMWCRDLLGKKTSIPLIEQTIPNLKELFNLTRNHITSNIVLRLPEEFTVKELNYFGSCHIDEIIWNGLVDSQFVYYRNDIHKNSKTTFDTNSME